MAAVAFDTLKYARRLIEAGVPEKQAEVQAELMAEAFVYNMDSLLTRDLLEARFAEHDARIDARFAEQDARIDARFAEQDARIDTRFAEQDARIEARFAEQNTRIDARFAEQDARNDVSFAEIHGQLKLHTWILGAVAASTVVPLLHSLLSP